MSNESFYLESIRDCNNNPINYVDPTGHSFISAISNWGTSVGNFFNGINDQYVGGPLNDWNDQHMGGPLNQIASGDFTPLESDVSKISPIYNAVEAITGKALITGVTLSDGERKAKADKWNEMMVSGAVMGSIGDIKAGDLPINARGMFYKYDFSGWRGSIPGQSPGTCAGGKYNNWDGQLPTTDSGGNAIIYREFDVNNKVQGQNRDFQRFVRGSDGSVYYTDNHYGKGSFLKVK